MLTAAVVMLAIAIVTAIVDGSRVPGQYFAVLAVALALVDAGARPVVAYQLFVIAALIDGALAWDLFRRPRLVEQS